jgi:hypothetical protein
MATLPRGSRAPREQILRQERAPIAVVPREIVNIQPRPGTDSSPPARACAAQLRMGHQRLSGRVPGGDSPPAARRCTGETETVTTCPAESQQAELGQGSPVLCGGIRQAHATTRPGRARSIASVCTFPTESRSQPRRRAGSDACPVDGDVKCRARLVFTEQPKRVRFRPPAPASPRPGGRPVPR